LRASPDGADVGEAALELAQSSMLAAAHQAVVSLTVAVDSDNPLVPEALELARPHQEIR
jgi:hypothetical protein